MKKIIIGSILSIVAATSFAAPGKMYNDFAKSPKKEEFLKNAINNGAYIEEETLRKQKCEGVSKFQPLYDGGDVVFLQISCKNIEKDLHLLLPKKENLVSRVHTCSEADKKFIPKVRCVGKLK